MTDWLEEQSAQASPDLLRSMVQTFAEALMGAEADAVCGAGYGERSDERKNTRKRVPVGRVGHPGRKHQPGYSQAAAGPVFPDWLRWNAAASPDPRRAAPASRTTKLGTTIDEWCESGSELNPHARDLWVRHVSREPPREVAGQRIMVVSEERVEPTAYAPALSAEFPVGSRA